MRKDFQSDVFLSYRQQEPDKTWVRKVLYPALRDSGLRVLIDFRDFRLGMPVITEMERGVLSSAYTVAVVTPAYLKSTFTEFENLISQHLGLEEAKNRLLIVVREQCDISLRLRYKLWLPMTTEGEFQENLPRLVQALSDQSQFQGR